MHDSMISRVKNEHKQKQKVMRDMRQFQHQQESKASGAAAATTLLKTTVPNNVHALSAPTQRKGNATVRLAYEIKRQAVLATMAQARHQTAAAAGAASEVARR